jgi:hypothetical protein
MPFVYVKKDGIWKTVQRMYVKKGGSWVDVKCGLVTKNGVGKQFYPDSVGPTTYSSPGSYTYTVPAGVTQLQVTYPTLSALTTTTVSVTPGASYTVTIGNYGSGSSFSSLVTAAAYTTTFGAFAGNVDSQVYNDWGVTTTAGNTFTGSGTSGTLNTNATAAGCYYREYGETAQGDFSATITINTLKTATVVNTLQASIVPISFRTDAGAEIITQPTSANGYILTARGYDGGYSNYYQAWQLKLEQIVSMTVTPVNANVATFTSGTNTWTAPTGVTSVTVSAAGGGGGQGANFLNSSLTPYTGTSGTAGQLITGTMAVTPGQTYTIQVGTGGGYGTANYSTATGGTAGSGYNNGTAGTSLNSSGGGGGGSTRISLGATTILVAAGGAGGAGANGGGAGGAGGGSNTVPSGCTATIGTNGGVCTGLTASYSGSYSNGTGSSQITSIHDTLVSSYSTLYSSIGTVNTTRPGIDYNFSLTLAASTVLLANGTGQAGWRYLPGYSTPKTSLNSGNFSVGNTVSGINFATGGTQGNGGQSFYFYTGDTWNSGGDGYVTITY